MCEIAISHKLVIESSYRQVIHYKKIVQGLVKLTRLIFERQWHEGKHY